MQMITLSYFTYFAENALEMVAKKEREQGTAVKHLIFQETCFRCNPVFRK